METDGRNKIAPKAPAADGRGGKRKPKREGRSMYDISDIMAASEAAYAKDMDGEELRTKRRRDWLALLIGIPAFIGMIYLIVYIYQRG